MTYIDEKDEPPTAYAVYPSPQRSVTIDPFGDFSQGRYLWFLEDVVKFDEPILASGRQGFWDWFHPRIAD